MRSLSFITLHGIVSGRPLQLAIGQMGEHSLSSVLMLHTTPGGMLSSNEYHQVGAAGYGSAALPGSLEIETRRR
jgi:hypothetical protein